MRPIAIAAAAHSAPVTHLWARVGLTVLILAALAGVYLLMWRAWRRRGARQAAAMTAPRTSGPDGAAYGTPSEGIYVSTTRAGDWLARIVAHGLGARSEATLRVGAAGVLITRTGADDLFIPAGAVRAVAMVPGMAGKFTAGDDIVAITWSLGDTPVDTGFLPRRAADRSRLLSEINGLTHENGIPA